MFEKQIKEKKKKIERLENSVSDEVAETVYNLAIYDTAPLAFGMRTFKQLEEKEIKSLKRIIAVSQGVLAADLLV